MHRIEPYLPLSHVVPRVNDRRVISGIIFVIRNGLRWRNAPRDCGPHKTIHNRFVRWSRLAVSGDTWRCGQRAAQALADFMCAGRIDCEERGQDRFWPFADSYHVFVLDQQNYRYALVSSPSRGYLWILAREPGLPIGIRNELVARARNQSSPVDELILVDHSVSTCPPVARAAEHEHISQQNHNAGLARVARPEN